MAIKLHTGNKRVSRVIEVREPLDGAAFKSHRVRVTFEILNKAEALEIVKQEDAPLLRRVVVGWGDESGRGGFDDESGAPIPFSAEALEQVVEIPWIAAALVRGYFDAANGGKLGN